MMPVKKLGVDAAILYSDIMNPVESIGIDFDIVANVGPVIHNPIRERRDVEKLRPIDVENDLGHVLETIRILDRELSIPLITFAGAPFTIASYLIEGRPSKNYWRTKQMMYSEPELWAQLMSKLEDMVVAYFQAQLKNGAKAIQLFDSWVGALAPEDFQKFVLPTIERIFARLSDYDQPKIYYPGVSSGELLPTLGGVQADVIGIDWRITLTEGRKRLDRPVAVQGNLDPTVLTAPQEVIEQYAKNVIDHGLRDKGFIFNLGHGLFPEVSLDKLKALTEFVHRYSEEAIREKSFVESEGV